MTGIIPELVSLERHPPDGFSHTSSRHFLRLLSAGTRVSLLAAVARERLYVCKVVISTGAHCCHPRKTKKQKQGSVSQFDVI